jgi:hypothetical protein
MVTSRRMMIAGAGATTLALVGGAGFWRVTRRPRTASLPWALDPKPPTDVRLDAFRHAILAPNPHNRQPWLIRLDGDDAATISCDLAKRLPDTDPFDRQITIGFGTFLELARMAAAERGVRMEIEPFPEGEPLPRLDARPIAKLRFVADAAIAKDPLFPSITRRRTNREVYDPDRIVPEAIARQIADGAFAVDPQMIAAVRAITVDAMTIEQTTTRTFKESIDLMRIGADEVDANPDGLSLVGPKMEALKLLGVLDRSSLGDQSSTAFKTGLEMQQEICGSIPALFWITSPENSRADQIEAGRRYVRANLRATMLGVAVHPLSQALQEYPEMAGRFSEIQKLLGAKEGQRVQMLARIGYAHPVEPAPRWPLEAHFRT